MEAGGWGGNESGGGGVVSVVSYWLEDCSGKMAIFIGPYQEYILSM